MEAPSLTALPLPAHEEQIRLLLDAIEDYAIFLLDSTGHVATWNTGAERLKGYTEEEIVGKHFSLFYPEGDVAAGKPQRILETARVEGRVEDEGWRIRKDGSRFWADVIVTPIRDGDGRVAGYAKVTRDLTAQRQTESALHQSEQRFRMLVEAVRDYALIMLSPEGIVVSWNGGAERIKGYTAEEIVGRHFSLFYPDDDVASGKPEMELEVAIAEGRYEDEGWRLRKDGSRFWANVILAPVRDDRGRLLGFAKVTRDMSERRRAREELQRSEQLNRDLRGESLAKDEFLGVISHELRTPLTVLYGGTKLLAQRYAQLAEDDRCELIESLAEEADRIKSLIESVFLLVNPSPNLDLRPVSLSAAVETAAKDFRRVAPARELRLHLPQRDSAVAVEGPLFQRVLLNLLGNADKYSPALRPIELAASTTPEGAVIEVQDRGPGVDPTELGLIFGSFYRSASTAEAVPGKGIGLAVCRRLITLFGGSIEARARKGGGLNIRITLPDIAGFAPEAT